MKQTPLAPSSPSLPLPTLALAPLPFPASALQLPSPPRLRSFWPSLPHPPSFSLLGPNRSCLSLIGRTKHLCSAQQGGTEDKKRWGPRGPVLVPKRRGGNDAEKVVGEKGRKGSRRPRRDRGRWGGARGSQEELVPEGGARRGAGADEGRGVDADRKGSRCRREGGESVSTGEGESGIADVGRKGRAGLGGWREVGANEERGVRANRRRGADAEGERESQCRRRVDRWKKVRRII